MLQTNNLDIRRSVRVDIYQEHPWVTKNGSDKLLSAEENCAHHIDPPNELELNHAFTRKMNHLLCVMKALQRFKALRAKIRARKLESQGLAADTENSAVDSNFDPAEARAKAVDIEALIEQRQRLLGKETGASGDSLDKGPDHNVSDQEPLFLGIGTGSRDDFAMDEATPNIVADSPTAVDFNVYDRAYEDAVERRLKSNPTDKPTLYLTRFVKDAENLKNLGGIVDVPGFSTATAGAKLAELTSKIGLAANSLGGGQEKLGAEPANGT